ncbi:uncharacterized protein METZ01_LOCUS485566 [marine metagenome]|uniref:Uncharacterized protein n=1 Tax=marine metagenome TaxID=408172 RepID=A0A383CKJ4_9ZZZZ
MVFEFSIDLKLFSAVIAFQMYYLELQSCLITGFHNLIMRFLLSVNH